MKMKELNEELPPTDFVKLIKDGFVKISENSKNYDVERHQNIVSELNNLIFLLDSNSQLAKSNPKNKYFKLTEEILYSKFLEGFENTKQEKNIYILFEGILKGTKDLFSELSLNFENIKNELFDSFPEIIVHVDNQQTLRDLKLKILRSTTKLREVINMDKLNFEQFLYECIEEQQKYLHFENSNTLKKSSITLEENPFSNEENYQLFNYFCEWFKPKGGKAKYSYILEHFQQERECQLLEKPFFEFVGRKLNQKIALRKQPSANNPKYFDLLKNIEAQFMKEYNIETKL